MGATNPAGSSTFKKLHLALSVVILIPIAIAYGISPDVDGILGFRTDAVDLRNMLRAIMGLYLATASFWLLGIFSGTYWKAATIGNVLVMGGLALGRLFSAVADGIPSTAFVFGMFAEFIIAFWGIWNLYRFRP